MEIISGVHRLEIPIPDNPLGHLNCYLVRGKDGWLMVDAGWNTDEAFAILQKGLKGIGLKLTDISTLFITHSHPDHYGLAGRIKQVSPQTRLLAHHAEADLIQNRYLKPGGVLDQMNGILQRQGVPSFDNLAFASTGMAALRSVTVVAPDHILYGGETISTGVYDLEVIWTPGHSPGHICLYEPQNRLLFAGDHVLPAISPNIGYNAQSGDNPLGDYLSALHKIEKLPVARVLPGHEQIFTDLPGRIHQLIDHHTQRKVEIFQAIRAGTHTAWEISSRISWDSGRQRWEQLTPMHQRLAVMETVAHLENMKWEGEVRRITGENQVTYFTP